VGLEYIEKLSHVTRYWGTSISHTWEQFQLTDETLPQRSIEGIVVNENKDAEAERTTWKNGSGTGRIQLKEISLDW